MGNALCVQEERNQKNPRLRNEILKKQLGLDERKQSHPYDQLGSNMILTQNANQYEKQLNGWLESLYDTVYINKSPEKSPISTTIHTCEDSEEPIEMSENDLKYYKEKYPYVSTNIDILIINSYVLSKRDFISYYNSKRMKKGVPKQRFRWSSWQLMAYEPLYQFQNLNLSRLEMDTKHDNAIQKDISRTVNNKEFNYFHENEGSGQKHLQKVLQKLSKLFPELGYCQGMNFIVGFVLLICAQPKKIQDEQQQIKQAFEFTAQLLVNPKYLLYYLYSDGMPLIHLLEYIMIKELQENIPQIYRQIYKKLKIEKAFWLTKIFMTIFLYNFNIKFCQRLWDIILCTNIFQTISLILAILECDKQKILSFQDIGDFLEWFDSFQAFQDLKKMEQIIEQSTQFLITKDKIQKYAQQLNQQDPHLFYEFNFQDYQQMQYQLQNSIPINNQ